MNPDRIFISYSHDSDEHKKKVLDFAERLRNERIDVWLDEYKKPGEGIWLDWEQEYIVNSRLVLIVCSELYEGYFSKGPVGQKGRGVASEARLIKGVLSDDPNSDKFVPVFFGSENAKFIPYLFKANYRFDLDIVERFAALVTYIRGEPTIHPPPLRQPGKTLSHRGLERWELAPGTAKLVESLERLAFLQIPENPRSVLQALPFAHRLAFSGDYVSITELTRLCFAENRGLAALVEVLMEQGQSLQNLAEICDALDVTWKRSIRWSTLVELKARLQELPIDRLSEGTCRDLFDKAIGKSIAISNPGRSLYLAGLDLVAGRNEEQILAYVLGALNYLKIEPRDALLEILQAIAKSAGLPLKLRGEPAATSGTKQCIVQIRVRPDADERARKFAVTAKMKRGSLGAADIVCQTVETKKEVEIQKSWNPSIFEAELRQAFRGFVAEACEKAALSDELRLEVFLPLELLYLPLESFGIPHGTDDEHPVGKRYRIIARSYERNFFIQQNRYRSTYGHWIGKWDAASRITRKHIATAEPGSRSEGQEKILISIEPVSQSDWQQAKRMLNSGFPVLLWTRENPQSDEEKLERIAKLERLLLSCTLGNIPDLIFKKRQDAAKDPSFWLAVGLVWDDPLRGPFEIPELNGGRADDTPGN